MNWATKSMTGNNILDIASDKDWYPSPLNLKTNMQEPSYFWSWSSWFWIIGGVFAISGLAYSGYLGYNYYQSIYHPTIYPDSAPGTPPVIPQLPPQPPQSNIIIPAVVHATEEASEGYSSEGIIAVLGSVKRALNPYQWWENMKSNPSSEILFRSQQSELNTFNNRYYPFTADDPFKSWHERIRTKMFGESEFEMISRLRLRDFALRDYTAIALQPNPIISGIQTPGMLGIHKDLTSGLYSEPSFLGNWMDASKLSQIPKTPDHLPFESVMSAGPSFSTSDAILSGKLNQVYPLPEIIVNEWNEPKTPEFD